MYFNFKNISKSIFINSSTLIIFISLLFLKPCYGFDIYDLSIDNLGNKINLEFEINLREKNIIKQVVDDGKKIVMSFSIKIKKKRTFLWNKEVISYPLELEIYKDMIRGNYVLKVSDYKKIYRNFLSLCNDIRKFQINLGSWKKIERGQYVLLIESKVFAKGVPNWLKDILFFWNFNLSGPYYFEMEINY